MRKYKPDYTPRTGFAWPISDMERTNEANKKQTDESASTSLPDADHDLIKKLEKEKAFTHPKKQQNTTLLLNAMWTTAAHSFQTFHEREAVAAAVVAASSDAVALSEGQRSSATPAPAPNPSQSAGSQSSGPSASQDSAKGAVTTVKRKKKRVYFLWTRIPHLWLNSLAGSSVVMPAPA